MITAKIVNRTEDTPYPKLMKSTSDQVVLMIGENTGVCLSGDNLGEYSDCWDEHMFRDFDGLIKIKNI